MFGEIVLCLFPFTSGAPGKVRPALVLFDLPHDAVICRISSVPRSGPLDIPVGDWQSAALLSPSVVRLDRLVTAEKAIFLSRLGTLSATDAGAVQGMESIYAVVTLLFLPAIPLGQSGGLTLPQTIEIFGIGGGLGGELGEGNF